MKFKLAHGKTTRQRAQYDMLQNAVNTVCSDGF